MDSVYFASGVIEALQTKLILCVNDSEVGGCVRIILKPLSI